MNKLEELDALVKAATPGPWDYVDSVVWIATHDSRGDPVQQKVADTGDEADAALIVWLVNNAPAMLRAQAEEIARKGAALNAPVTDAEWSAAYLDMVSLTMADEETEVDTTPNQRGAIITQILLRRRAAALGSPPDA